jgi:hypothetical protein
VASVVSAEQKADYQLQHPDAKVLATNQTVAPPSYGYVLATRAALGDPAKLKAIGDLTRRLIVASNWEKSHQAQWVTDYYAVQRGRGGPVQHDRAGGAAKWLR